MKAHVSSQGGRGSRGGGQDQVDVKRDAEFCEGARASEEAGERG